MKFPMFPKQPMMTCEKTNSLHDMDEATSTMANPSIHREQVYGEVQVLFLSSCPQNSLEK